MGKIILFIATSLDSYIAREDGGIEWLFSDADYGYSEFFASVGATLTGAKTYRQTLSFTESPYPGKVNYVFTRSGTKSNERVIYISDNINEFCKELKNNSVQDIWLVGGGQINSLLLDSGLIDEIIISIHPIILGSGIPLFDGKVNLTNLTLQVCKTFPSGLVQLHYKVNI